MSITSDFFQNIQSFNAFGDLFDAGNMHAVPDDWYAVVADIQGSTQAVSEGRYKDVNVVGASCIIAVLNELDGVEIPYVFGGDGASFVVPESAMRKVAKALCGTKAVAKDVFNLTLRLGAMPVKQIYADHKTLKVSKYQVSPAVSIAMFHGGGLGYAEECIKSGQDEYDLENWLDEGAVIKADFNGLECRWNPVEARKDHILTLMVLSEKGDDVYQDVMQKIAAIYHQGDFSPVKTDALSLSFNGKNLSQEHGVQTYKSGVIQKMVYRLKMICETILGTMLFTFDWSMAGVEGKKYVADVVANTDFQKFDDTLRMVLDSSKEQSQELQDYLDAEHRKGNLFYGVSVSDSAMLTCLIFERKESHLHFVDGQAGGYTMAAKKMKRQMKGDMEEVALKSAQA